MGNPVLDTDIYGWVVCGYSSMGMTLPVGPIYGLVICKRPDQNQPCERDDKMNVVYWA